MRRKLRDFSAIIFPFWTIMVSVMFSYWLKVVVSILPLWRSRAARKKGEKRHVSLLYAVKKLFLGKLLFESCNFIGQAWMQVQTLMMTTELISNIYSICLHEAYTCKILLFFLSPLFCSFPLSLPLVYMLKLLIITDILVQKDNICCDSNPPFFALCLRRYMFISLVVWNLQIMIHMSSGF